MVICTLICMHMIISLSLAVCVGCGLSYRLCTLCTQMPPSMTEYLKSTVWIGSFAIKETTNKATFVYKPQCGQEQCHSQKCGRHLYWLLSGHIVGSMQRFPGFKASKSTSIVWSVSRQLKSVKTFAKNGRHMESKWHLGPRNK